MENSQRALKSKIIFSIIIMIILTLASGFLGWKLNRQVERSKIIIETVHLFKEAELQLRREEKNLIIRGYSEARLTRWQNAKEDFNQRFGQLIGMEVLNDNEIKKIKATISEMSDEYNKFFHDIQDHSLSDDEIAQFDAHFKKIGRGSLVIIDEILLLEMEDSDNVEWQMDILLIGFAVVFIFIASFLVVNVLKHL